MLRIIFVTLPEIKNNYDNENELNMCKIQNGMSHGHPVRQKVKCKCFLCVGKGSNCSTFFTVPDMSAGQAFMCYCFYVSLSGFFTIPWVYGFFTSLPYLVLKMFSPSFMYSLTTLVLKHTSSDCFLHCLVNCF